MTLKQFRIAAICTMILFFTVTIIIMTITYYKVEEREKMECTDTSGDNWVHITNEPNYWKNIKTGERLYKNPDCYKN